MSDQEENEFANKILEYYKKIDEKDPQFNLDEQGIYDLLAFFRFMHLIRNRLRKDWDLTIAVTGERGCQPKGSKILMADGSWKNVEDISMGDEIISPQSDGTNIFAKILHVTRWICPKIYSVRELTRQKKELYRCSFNHQIPINRYNIPKEITNYGRKGKTKEYRNWEVYHPTAEEYSYKSIFRRSGESTLTSFLIHHFKGRKNCSIDPYTLGVWLGDGHFTTALGITNSNKNVINEVIKYIKPLREYHKDEFHKTITYSFSINSILGKELTKLNLRNRRSGDKFIPKEAMYSNVEYRKKLLAGLIDTDGYLGKGGNYSITTKSKEMAENILFLIYSLGGRGTITKVYKGIKKINFVGEYYCVSFYIQIQLPLQVKYKIRKIGRYCYNSANRISVEVVPIDGKMDVYGFVVNSPSSWYITDNFAITHNSGKSVLSVQAGTIIQEGKISNALMKKFITDRMLLAPTQEEVIAIHKEKAQEYGVLVLDEAIRIAYNRESMKGSNIDMNKLYTVNRKENMCHILCIPMFYALDPFWRNDRIKYWIHIYDRGKAVVFAQSDNPFTRDKWNLKYNEFSFRNFTMKNRRKEYEVEDFEKLSIYKRSPNFLMSFTFPKINDDLLTYYKGLTEEKRYDFDTNKKVKEEVKEEIEEKITYPTKCFHCKYEWKARIKRPKNCPRCKQKLAYSDY